MGLRRKSSANAATSWRNDLDRMPGARWFPECAASTSPKICCARRDDAARADLSRRVGPSRIADVRGSSRRALHQSRRICAISASDPAIALPRSFRTGSRPSLRCWPRLRSAACGVRALPDFGAAAIVDRFGQVEPKVLIGCDGYRYAGKWFDCSATVGRSCAATAERARDVMIRHERGGRCDVADRIARL